MRVTRHNSCRVSPFGNPRITVWLSTTRGLSQIPTSFIGSWYQGIHRAPLKTYDTTKIRCSRPLCSSQNTTPQPPTQKKNPFGTEERRTTKQAQPRTADTRKPNSAPHATRTNQHPRYPHPPKGSTHAAPAGTSHITDVPPTSKTPRISFGHDRRTHNRVAP